MKLVWWVSAVPGTSKKQTEASVRNPSFRDDAGAGRVGEDVTTLTPHGPGRAGLQHPVLHGRASLATAY